MSTTETKLLLLREAAARLRICVRKYYRLIAARELPPPIKLGKKSLVLESDVEAYIARLISQRDGNGPA